MASHNHPNDPLFRQLALLHAWMRPGHPLEGDFSARWLELLPHEREDMVNLFLADFCRSRTGSLDPSTLTFAAMCETAGFHNHADSQSEQEVQEAASSSPRCAAILKVVINLENACNRPGNFDGTVTRSFARWKTGFLNVKAGVNRCKLDRLDSQTFKQVVKDLEAFVPELENRLLSTNTPYSILPPAATLFRGARLKVESSTTRFEVFGDYFDDLFDLYRVLSVPVPDAALVAATTEVARLEADSRAHPVHLEAARQRVRKLQAVGNPYLQQLVEALADLNKPPASEHSPPAHFRGLLLFRRLSNQEQAFATFRARELVVDHCRNYQETGSLHDPHIIISKLVNLLKTRESATTLRCRRSCIEALAQVVKLYSQHAASSTDPNDPVVHLKKLLAFLEPFESAHFFNALPEDRLKSCAMRCFSIDSQVQKEWGHNGRVITASETYAAFSRVFPEYHERIEAGREDQPVPVLDVGEHEQASLGVSRHRDLASEHEANPFFPRARSSRW